MGDKTCRRCWTEGDYVRSIVELEEDAEACWLMEMTLPIAR